MIELAKVSDEQIIKELIEEKKSVGVFCKEHNLYWSTFCKRLKRMRDKGKLPADFGAIRQTKRKLPDDSTLTDLYVNKGWGICKLSKEYDTAPSNVSVLLKRLGILDSSRAYEKSEKISRRARRPKSKEFLASTKSQRFQEERGICEICHHLIGDGQNWRLATYHHRKPIKDGGGREPENCMVLHEECHEEYSYELHGFEMSNYDKVACQNGNEPVLKTGDG